MIEKHILKRLSEIVDNLEKAQLEEVTELLNYYNGKPVIIDGVTHHPYNDPRLAATINARYKELTGEDHPVFLREQGKVIDSLLEDKEQLIEAGAYTPMYFDTLEQLKGNLSNDTPTMEVVNGYSKHALGRMTNILDNLENAQLEDVSELLNYYNGKPVLIDGVTYHLYNDPRTAARINARYKELTGEDHPVFLREQGKVIDELLADKEMLIETGAYTPMYFDTLEQLKGNLSNDTPTMEVVNGYSQHVLGRMTSIVEDLENAQLEDVSELLNYYNGKPVLIDGVSHHPYNDPMLAAKINARYKELTGEDHPVFLREQGKVIDLEEVRTAVEVKNVKTSDINEEYNAIKSQQELEKDELNR